MIGLKSIRSTWEMPNWLSLLGWELYEGGYSVYLRLGAGLAPLLEGFASSPSYGSITRGYQPILLI